MASSNNLYPRIRNLLSDFYFEKTRQGDWALRLPLLYSKLFTMQEPELFRKSIGWRQSPPHPGMVYTYVKRATNDDIQTIKCFIEDYRRWMLIGPSNALQGIFATELDACLAL